MASKVTADPHTRVITITESPVGSLSSINAIEDIYSALKDDWLSNPLLQPLKFPFEVVGGDPISDTEEVGRYIFIKNQEGWRLQPFDSDQELKIVGNLFARDFTLPLWLSRSGRTIVIQTERSSLATSLQQASLEFSSYAGGVTVDPNSSFIGTSFPVGTLQAPVNNIEDALLIATARGLNRFLVLDDLPITTGNFSGKTFTAEIQGVVFTVSSGAIIDDTRWENATLSGDFRGDNVHIHGCHVESINYSGEFIEECSLVGTITLSGTGPVFIARCLDADPGSGIPTLDLADFTGALSVREYFGGIKLQNKTTSSTVALDLATGRVVVDSSVSAGMVRVRGIGTLEDNSTGSASVDSVSLLSRDTVADAVLDNSISAHQAVSGSMAEALAIIKGLVQSNFVLDNTSYNSQGLLSSGRIRIFDTGSQVDNATDGGTGQGEIFTFNIAATDLGAGNENKVKVYKVKKV